MSQEYLQDQFIGFLNTPPLWENTEFGIQQFEIPALELESFQPQSIPQNIRLGHQMEYVFKQLMEHSETYEVILHNLPVKQGNRTIGEIDFILNERATQKLIHVELTCKFYIINPEITEPMHRLMGPNKRDMFFTKMEKIKNEQFALLHAVEGIKTLGDHSIDPSQIEHQCCYKAQLYEPYGHTITNISPLNKACIVGYWLRFKDFNTTEFKVHDFYIPNKSQWVIEPHNQVEWISHFEVLTEIDLRMLKENAPMIWMKKSETEFEKFFVLWWE